jgi:hypothetical protein
VSFDEVTPCHKKVFLFLFLDVLQYNQLKESTRINKEAKRWKRGKDFFHREKEDNVSFLAIFVVSTIIKIFIFIFILMQPMFQ